MLKLLQVVEYIGLFAGLLFGVVLWKYVIHAIIELHFGEVKEALPIPSLMLASGFARSAIVGSPYFQHPFVDPSTLSVEAKVLVPPRIYEEEEAA